MNSSWFFAAESAWRWPTAAACLLLMVGIVWLELRKKRSHAWLRITLSWLAIGALFLLAWQPAYRQALTASQAVLLTANASQSSLDSLRERRPGMQIFSLETGQEEKEFLTHPSYLQQTLAPGSRLFVLGDGPQPATLSYLQEYELLHLPGEKKEGLRTLTFPPDLRKGDTLFLQGNWHQVAHSVRIKLSLAGKLLDSAMVYPDSQNFLLRHLPRLSGPLQYQLWAENEKRDTLENLAIPIRVQETDPLHIGLFAGYPSFENKYLKNWLARQGHAVFYQAEMAPDRYVREWLNLPDKKLTGLNKKLLRQVDLLVVDQLFFTGLSLHSHQLIEAAVKEGLGLLVLANGTNLSWPRQAWEQLPPLRINGSVQEESLFTGQKSIEQVLLRQYQAEGADWIGQKGRADKAGLLHVPYGLGTVGVSLLMETYPLLLKSKEEVYAKQWAFLLSKIAGLSTPINRIRAEFPAFQGQRQELVVWQTEKERPELVLTEPNGQKQVLPLIQDSQVPERWYAYQWPKEKGFYQLAWPGTDSLRFQVLDSAALPAWRQNETTRRLQTFQMRLNGKKEQPENPAVQKQIVRYREQGVPYYWFYLLFLVCLTGLWVEQKLNAP